jgi:hypothetical protein
MLVELQGKKYRISPLTLDCIGEIEQYILANRESPLRVAKKHLEGLSPDAQKHLLSLAWDAEQQVPNYVTHAQFEWFLDSRLGTAYSFWLMLRVDQPNITFDEVEKIVHSLTEDELKQIHEWRDQLSGMDHLGNETGSDSEPTTNLTEKTDGSTGG